MFFVIFISVHCCNSATNTLIECTRPSNECNSITRDFKCDWLRIHTALFNALVSDGYAENSLKLVIGYIVKHTYSSLVVSV